MIRKHVGMWHVMRHHGHGRIHVRIIKRGRLVGIMSVLHVLHVVIVFGVVGSVTSVNFFIFLFSIVSILLLLSFPIALCIVMIVPA